MLVSGVTTNAGAGGRALGGSNGRHQQSLRSSEYKSSPYQPHGRHGVFVSFIERAVQDTRPDLADRGLFVTLRPISEAQRRLEKELWREFELARPRLLGALLDAVSHGLRMRPQRRVDRLPRMADFALWAPRAKPRSGPPARSRPPTWRTEGPQSTTLSMPTRWRLACTRSWPSGASGWERHRPSACRGHSCP